MAWLTSSSPGYNDARLWSRLLETPYDDVYVSWLVAELTQRKREAAPLPRYGSKNSLRFGRRYSWACIGAVAREA